VVAASASPATTTGSVDPAPGPKLEPARPNPANASEPAAVPAVTPAAGAAKPDDAANPIHKLVDALLAAKSGEQKQAALQQLVKSGQMDAAIEDLKQRAADNPNNPEYPTTLGEALLNKIKAIHDAGPTADNTDEMGILAMQADQNFNTALKIDPQNWEAQFVKAASMYYWPADPTRDNDVVQRLSGLIDQQETMTASPAFAQTYVVLGNEYQKMGQPDKAQATWQLGLTQFPNDPTLQKKLNGQ
jgi:tetratricopeptide (TPR) repeat protein